MQLVLRPFSAPTRFPEVPSALFMAGQHLINLIEGFVPSTLAHQFGESPAWELADILLQPGPGCREVGFGEWTQRGDSCWL